MSDDAQTLANRGDFALIILRLALFGTTSALVGVLAHIAWKSFAG